jgi:hypothetical protein
MNLFSVQLDIFAGLIYGFFYFKFLRGYLLISDEFITKLESLFLCLKKLDCFIEVSKIKQSIKYHVFKTNTSQSSIEMPTTPGGNLSSPQKLNENVKLFEQNADHSVSKLSVSERSSDNNSTGIKEGSSLGKIISSDLKVDIK